MSSPGASPLVRWLRAGVVAGVAGALGVAAHVVAGGLLPSLPVLAVLTGTLVVLSAAALGRQASYRLVAVLVAGGQAMVHLVLTATAGHGGPHVGTQLASTSRSAETPAGAATPPSTYLDLMSPDSEAATAMPAAGGMPHWLQHLRDDLTGTNLLMSLAHLAAAAVVAWWLFIGEQALWTLLVLIGTRLVLPLAAITPIAGAVRTTAPGCVPGAVEGGWSRARRHAINGGLGRRGPPMHGVLPLSTSPAS